MDARRLGWFAVGFAVAIVIGALGETEQLNSFDDDFERVSAQVQAGSARS